MNTPSHSLRSASYPQQVGKQNATVNLRNDTRLRWLPAVLVAEIVKNFQPRLVELHNYR
jgi:hypothetical protein